MFKLIKSVFKSAKEGIGKDPQIKKVESKYPRFFKWLGNRLDPDYKYGRFLTIGCIFFALFIFFFLGVIQDIFARDPLALADQRITNLFVLFRSPNITRVMLYITYLGKWQLVVLGAILLSIILFLTGKRKYLYTLAISVAGGSVLTTVLKNVITRQRPSIANAVIVENSFSFPSGHTFVVFSFYLLAAFILWGLIRNRTWRIILVLSSCVLALLIPLSRIYLGVHWTSDIVGTFSLGLAWLTVFITYLVIQDHFDKREAKPLVDLKYVKYLSILFLISWLGFSIYYYKANSYEKVVASKTVTLATTAIDSAGIPDNIFKNLPRTSEGLTGKVMEPINFVFIGSKENMDTAFKVAGWVPTDKINISTSWKIGYSTLFDKPYATAPGTPSFWDSRPNDYSYEKPTSSVREREHIHIWVTPYVVNGEPLWLGTAHFDKSVKLTTNFIPTHEIDPLVDNERNLLKQQLLDTGKVTVKEVKIVEPTTGKNLAGSVFYTDGNGYLITLK